MPKSTSSLEKRFLKVAQKMFPGGEQTWVLDLCSHLDPPAAALPGVDEGDEPPLFTRSRQVSFFADVPLATSGLIVLKVALGILRAIAEVIDSAEMPDRQVYSACVTLMDWDAIDEVCPVPTPSIFVEPHGDYMRAGYVVRPYTSQGKAVVQWLADLGGDFSDLFCVGESSPDLNPDLKRVYVGFQRTSKNLRSTGHDLGDSPAPK